MRVSVSARPSTAARVQSESPGPLGPGQVQGTGVAPMAGRDLADQHVRLPIRRTLLHAIDDIVNALDDCATLLRRERALGHVNFGDRHAEPLRIKYLAILGIDILGVSPVVVRPRDLRRFTSHLLSRARGDLHHRRSLRRAGRSGIVAPYPVVKSEAELKASARPCQSIV